MLSKKTIFALLLPMLLCYFSGCSNQQIPGLVKTEGVVKYNGSPVEGVTVIFSPANSNDTNAKIASGITDVSGKFQLMTLESTGALPGEYQITFTKKTVPQAVFSEDEDKGTTASEGTTVYHIPQKYDLTSTSGITHKIEKAQTDIVFELTD